MKIQDVSFLVILLFMLLLKRPRYFIWAGLFSLLLSLPLFSAWIFFTAERLTWYAACFLLLFLVFVLRQPHRVK